MFISDIEAQRCLATGVAEVRNLLGKFQQAPTAARISSNMPQVVD
jgi:hypothetical protein